MMDPLLKTRLQPVIERLRAIHRRQQLTLAWSGAALVSLAAVLLNKLTGLSMWFVLPAVLFGTGLVTLFIRRRAESWQPDLRVVARTIEQQHPELHELLITAVEQEPDPATGRLNFLQERVVLEALADAHVHQWADAVTRRELFTARAVHGLAVAVFAFAAVSLFQSSPFSIQWGRGGLAALRDAVNVTPGDTELERGSGLIVIAKFSGTVPSEAVLVVQPENQPEQRLPLVRNLDDPTFGGGLTQVDAPLKYRIEYAGGVTREFRVGVFEFPRLERADAKIGFPGYTKLPAKEIPDTRRVSAVEGSALSVAFHLNKPVASAVLEARDGTSLPLVVTNTQALASLNALALTLPKTARLVSSRRDEGAGVTTAYTLRLVDAEGRTNKVASQFTITVLPNREPELKFQFPKGDQQVSALQEVPFNAELWDDFGMARYGMNVSVAGAPPQEIVFDSATAPQEKRTLAHLLKLEDIGVVEDDLVSWHLWAEDIGPDGQPRRVQSDMFFAEVRPFEKIYRPGQSGESQSQSQSQSQSGAQAMELADLQKQIITGTWNLVRQVPASGNVSTNFANDVAVLREAQANAIEQAEAMAEEVSGQASTQHLQNALKAMQLAEDTLTAAGGSPKQLNSALNPEQSAYAALLKLAARELEVSRSQSRSRSQSSQQRNQRELDNLDLKPEDNRYEQQSQAQSDAERAQQQEELTFLNRLKELAQRQQDVNERLKELQAALNEARTEQEREELKRQLKRLQEEQQQQLADIDELQQRMEQSQNQAELSQERQQLEQARNQAQQAAERMERNETQQAQASGARAQEQLQDLRDEYRRKTGQQFREDMRELRNDARELADNQEQIGRALAEPQKSTERRSLESGTEREQLTQQFQQQQKDLASVLETMRRISEEAEGAEPLLSRELYDTLRKTAQQAPASEALEYSEKLAERGYTSQARQFEEKAREQINTIKDGVERAAETVLGDEAEALRLARSELDALAEQISRELRRSAPELAGGPNDASRTNAPGGSAESPSASQRAPGERGERGEPQQGQPGGSQNDSQQTQQQTGSRAAGEPSPDGQPQPASTPSGQQPGQQSQEGQQPGQPGGQQPGQQPGQQAGQGQQPGENGQPSSQQNAQGQQPGGQQPGQQAQAGGGGGGGGNGQQSRSEALQRLLELRAQAREAGGNPDTPGAQPRGERPSLLGEARLRQPGEQNTAGGGGWGGGGAEWNAGPLRGDNYLDWSDRLRNVEEMLDDPGLRAEIARIREYASGVRVEFKRHSKEPQWDMVRTRISDPLVQVRDRVAEELARKGSREALVPIDRDPVPAQFSELVRRYYEELGKSR